MNDDNDKTSGYFKSSGDGFEKVLSSNNADYVNLITNRSYGKLVMANHQIHTKLIEKVQNDIVISAKCRHAL